MHALWTSLRRYVASAMLAAMVSLVFHGGVMAGLHQHATGSPGCGPSALLSGHSHAASTHDHGSDPSHGGGDLHDHDAGGQESAAGPCCGSVCSIAVSVRVTDVTCAPVAASVELVPEDGGRPDNRPDGLKRPPRTPDIA